MPDYWRKAKEPYVTTEDVAAFVTLPLDRRIVELGELHGEQEWFRHRLADNPQSYLWAILAVTISAIAVGVTVDEAVSVSEGRTKIAIFAVVLVFGVISYAIESLVDRARHNLAKCTTRLAAFEQAHEAVLAGHVVAATEAQSAAADEPTDEMSVRTGHSRNVVSS